MLALVTLFPTSRALAATSATPADDPVLSLTAPPGGLVGPGSGLEPIWTIVNHSETERRVTLEIATTRAWPLARTIRGITIPANDSVRFLVPGSVPDTAAAGDVSVSARVRLDDDATPLDSCVSVYSVRSAPSAGVPVEIEPDLVRLEWDSWLRWQDTGIVEVSRDGRSWSSAGAITADEHGRCAFEDRGVTPGGTVGYRLRATVAGLTMVSAVTTVQVPERVPLAIAGLRPNPSHAAPVVAFTLPERAPTRLDVFDLAGRRIWASDLGVLAPGTHTLALRSIGVLPSGVYLFRLTHGARSVSARGVIVHD